MFLLLALTLLFCSRKKGSEVVDGAIDEQYINSEVFRSFDQKINREQKRAIRQEQKLISFLQGKMQQNKKGELYTVPFVIGEQELESIFDQKPIVRSSVISLLGYDQIYHPVASAEGGNLQYNLFLTCKVASYKDCLLWFASAAANKIIHLQMIATYKKTLSYSTIPQIRVDFSSIAIDIQQSSAYLLNAVNSYSLHYRITAKGQLVRTQYN